MTVGPAVAEAAGWAPLSRVLICDDRPDQRRVLTDLVRLMPDRPAVAAVGDGPDAVRVYTAAPADLVLVGTHRDSRAGTDAVHLLLERYPTATVIVYGPVVDAAPLIAALGSTPTSTACCPGTRN